MSSEISLTVTIAPTGARMGLKVEPETIVYDLCRDIRSRLPDVANVENPNDFGIFVGNTDAKLAYWLESAKPISHYMVKDQMEVEYRCKLRRLIVRTLDDTKKTLEVDDSKPVSELLLPICTKMGITNYDEYSLVRQLGEQERMKTLTLRKSKSIAKDYDKLERMKQKLHTDDDLNWLSHSKTLRQQSIDDAEELILRRKYFFSDQNVDARDPVQLNLLYVQLKSAILNGTHPITQDEAIQLAGIQCQIEFNNYVSEKMKSVNLDLAEYLPKEYVKVKGIDKKVTQLHIRFTGLQEMDAKVRYTQLCRSLNTYGITFFLVKEKIKGKNRLAPRLFGISKESVMRVDERTKEVLKTWPLTTVRRWAATANLFTLDFGDYSESNYVMQTTEGEQIAQLISGYIDIIVKKQKSGDMKELGDDEESTMIEDNVEPARANVIAHQRLSGAQRVEQGNVALPGVMRTAGGLNNYTEGVVGLPEPQAPQVSMRQRSWMGEGGMGQSHSPAQYNFQVHDLAQPSRGLSSRVEDNIQLIQQAMDSLDLPLQATYVGHDAAAQRWRQQSLAMARSDISSHIGATCTATGDLVAMVTSDNSDSESTGSIDYSTLNTAVSSIGLHTHHLMERVRFTAQLSLNNNEGDQSVGGSGQSQNLVDAARKLAQAFQDLIKAAQFSQSGDQASRKNLLEAASRVGESSKHLQHVFASIDGDSQKSLNLEKREQEALLARAKDVANATATLVVCAKRVATALSQYDDASLWSSQVISAAKLSGIATSRLVTCAKVVVCSLHQPSCQQRLKIAAKQVGHSVETVLQCSNPLFGRNDELAYQIESCTGAVHHAVDRLMEQLHQGTVQAHQDSVVIDILATSDNLQSGVGSGPGDSPALVEQAQILARVGSKLASSLKQRAELVGSVGGSQQKRLLAAAKKLAEATAKLVEMAKTCATSPPNHCQPQQEALVSLASQLTTLVQSAAGDELRQRAFKGLEFAARVAGTTAAQLIVTSQQAARFSRASNYQACNDASDLTDNILPRLIFACSQIVDNAEDPFYQNDLLNASHEFVQTFQRLIESSQAIYPTVRDSCCQMALTGVLRESQSVLVELGQSLARAERLTSAAMPPLPSPSPSTRDLAPVPSSFLVLDAAIDRLVRVLAELNTAADAADEGMLLPLPGEKFEDACATLGSAVHSLRETMTQISLLASQDDPSANFPPQEAWIRGLAEAMTTSIWQLVAGSRGIAAFHVNDNSEQASMNQQAILKSSRDVVTQAQVLLQHIKLAIVSSAAFQQTQDPLQQLSMGLIHALNDCLRHIPGRRHIDHLSSKMSHRVHRLTTNPRRGSVPSASGKSSSQLQAEFSSAAVNFTQIIEDLASGREVSTLDQRTSRLSGAYDNFVDCGEAVLSHCDNSTSPDSNDVAAQLRGGLVEASRRSSQFLEVLLALVDVGCSRQAQDRCRQALLQRANSVMDSINQLVSMSSATVASSSSPLDQQAEVCNRHLASIAQGRLNNPANFPVTNQTHYACTESIIVAHQEVKSIVERLIKAAKDHSDPIGACEDLKMLTDTCSRIIEASLQGSYLVGVSDPRSQPGYAGFQLKGHPLESHHRAIVEACASITTGNTSDAKTRELASFIAKQAGASCQLCKQLITECPTPSSKMRLAEAAKEVARSTSILVNSVRGGGYSGDNQSPHNTWLAATQQVSQSVLLLVDLLSSAEFACQPAKISPEAVQAQQPIVTSSKAVVTSANNFIGCIASFPGEHKITGDRKALEASIEQLVSFMRSSAPGKRQCEEALREIDTLIRQLDRACLTVANQQSLTSNSCHSNKACESSLEVTLSGLGQLSGMMSGLVASCGEGVDYQLGRGVARASSYLCPLVEGSVRCAAGLRRSQEQMLVLEQSKTVLEATSQLITAMLRVVTCDKTLSPCEVEECGAGVKEACSDLSELLKDISTRQGNLNTLIEEITNSFAKLDQAPNSPPPSPELVSRLLELARNLSVLSQSVLSEGKQHHHHHQETPGTVRPTVGVGQVFLQMVRVVQHIVTDLNTNPKTAGAIRVAIQNLGQACISQMSSQLPEDARSVSESISQLVTALQSTPRGNQAMIAAANGVQTVIADLETTVLFASAGSLTHDNLSPSPSSSPASPTASFFQSREEILKTAKSLVTKTRDLVTWSCRSDELETAKCASECLLSIQHLAAAGKAGAAQLGGSAVAMATSCEDSPEQSAIQVALVNAVIDVAACLKALLTATRQPGVVAQSDTARLVVKECAQVMVNSVTSLLKTVKTAEDQSLRGTRALESAIDSIAQEGRNINQRVAVIEEPVLSRSDASRNLICCVKQVMVTVAKAFSARTYARQEELMSVANLGRKTANDLTRTLASVLACRPGLQSYQTTSLDETLQSHTQLMLIGFKDVFQGLLKSVVSANYDSAADEMAEASGRVSQAAQMISETATQIKDSENRSGVNNSLLAEDELLEAANQIENAANKLALLRPRIPPKPVLHTFASATNECEQKKVLNLEDQILTAAKATIREAGVLVEAASVAQQELVAQGRLQPSIQREREDEETQWSQGLVSAARMVGAAIHNLCEAANIVVRGGSQFHPESSGSHERLISSSRQVASSTAQLLVACVVKADQNSEPMRRLQTAGSGVKRATEQLVRAAQKASQAANDVSSQPSSEVTAEVPRGGVVASMRKIIQTQSEIGNREKELENLRVHLASIRHEQARSSKLIDAEYTTSH